MEKFDITPKMMDLGCRLLNIDLTFDEQYSILLMVELLQRKGDNANLKDFNEIQSIVKATTPPTK